MASNKLISEAVSFMQKSVNEAAITVTFDVEDGKKFKNTLRDFGLRGKDVKGDGGVRGDSVEVKGDSKKLKKLVKDADRELSGYGILRVHDNGQLKEEGLTEGLYSVEYTFKSPTDAKAAATFVAKHASPGKLEINVNGKVVDVYVVGGMHGSGQKELGRAHSEVEKYFKSKIVKSNIENEEVNEAAIDDLRKIVKTKSMGKVSGTKVDLFSASAMVQVYDALNDKNRAKVDKMLKDKRGVMTFADFAMSQATKK